MNSSLCPSLYPGRKFVGPTVNHVRLALQGDNPNFREALMTLSAYYKDPASKEEELKKYAATSPLDDSPALTRHLLLATPELVSPELGSVLASELLKPRATADRDKYYGYRNNNNNAEITEWHKGFYTLLCALCDFVQRHLAIGQLHTNTIYDVLTAEICHELRKLEAILSHINHQNEKTRVCSSATASTSTSLKKHRASATVKEFAASYAPSETRAVYPVPISPEPPYYDDDESSSS